MSQFTDIIAPESGSTVLIYNPAAAISGALSVLNYVYRQVRDYSDKSVRWVFVVSMPEFEETHNIIIKRYPGAKYNLLRRIWLREITLRELCREYKPSCVVSLQNMTAPNTYRGGGGHKNIVYFHNSIFLTDYRFSFRRDGKRFWVYQNLLAPVLLHSLRRADIIIVQTHWIKNALSEKAGIPPERLVVLPPDINAASQGRYLDTEQSRRKFFYPAMSYTYKNHMTLLKAIKYAASHGLNDYELVLTIRPDESTYTRELEDYAKKNELNVKFAGMLPREEVLDRMKSSVLVFPSFVESYPLPMREAVLTGCPIIASDMPFSREILAGYDKVSYFDAMDYEQMGREILKVAKLEV